MSARHGDAIVVGAGIVGAACALALVRDGWRVTVLDRAYASAGTTSVGMGHIVVMDDSPAQLALTAYGVERWHDLAPELDARSERDPCGTLWIAEDDTQIAALRNKRETYASARVQAELLAAGELAEVEPNLRPGLAGALLVPGDEVIYPPGATLRLLALARQEGAVVRDGVDVSAIVPNGVRTATGMLRADIVVNAGGVAAAALTPELPIIPRKGHLAITDRYPGFCRHQLVELGYLTSAHSMSGESVAFNVQPRPTGQVLIGSSRELSGWNAQLNRDVLQRMLARATELMPALGALAVIRSWTGFRPATADKLPLIGRWEPTPGLWIAAGHEGLGITTSLATAQIIADRIAGRMPAIDDAPFAPMRALGVAPVQ